MLRRLVLVLCLLTCACGRDGGRAAMTESRIPPSLSPRFYPPAGWTFGLIRAGDAPAQRYGVAAPVGLAPRGHVLILIDYGESAEAWYETIRDLNAQGLTVWVLERLAQGGSARYSDRRDLGHAVSLDPDIAAVIGLIRQVIRPSDGVLMIGQGEGALIGMRAAAQDAPIQAMVISSPLIASSPETPLHARLRLLGLGGLRATRSTGWTREAADPFARGRTHDPRRGGVEKAWQLFNPDLRMGGPSLSRVAAVHNVLADLQPGAIRQPALILEKDQAGADFCRRMPQCEHRVLDGGGDFYLETDARRQPWLEAVERFVSDQIAMAASSTPPA